MTKKEKTAFVALSTIVLTDELSGDTKRFAPKDNFDADVDDKEIKRLLDKKAIARADDVSAAAKARQKIVDARAAAADAEAEQQAAEQQQAQADAAGDGNVSDDEVPSKAGAGGTSTSSGNNASGRTTKR